VNNFLLAFAGKNIWRHKGRSFFISFSVSLAVTVSVWVMAFFDGMNFQIEKAVVNTNTGHFQIQEQGYAFNTEANTPLPWTQEVEQTLQKSRALAYSPELVLDANISTPEGSAGLIAIGIIPQFHSKFLPIASNITSGEFIKDNEYGVVIGRELARDFKFKVGDDLVLNYQDHLGELRSELLPIKGIYEYNANVFQRRFVYISQQAWQELFFGEFDGYKFNRIPLIFTSFDKALTQIEKLKSQYKVKSWKELNPEMGVVLDFHHGMVRLFFLIIGVTIMMTILTPVRMLWQERLKEFKMLHTLGLSFKNFWQIGLSEIFLMVIISSFLSTFILGVILSIQSYTGLDFSFLNQGLIIERSGIRLPRVIYPRISAEQILITITMVISVLGISYTWSISRTLKKLKEQI